MSSARAPEKATLLAALAAFLLGCGESDHGLDAGVWLGRGVPPIERAWNLAATERALVVVARAAPNELPRLGPDAHSDLLPKLRDALRGNGWMDACGDPPDLECFERFVVASGRLARTYGRAVEAGAPRERELVALLGDFFRANGASYRWAQAAASHDVRAALLAELVQPEHAAPSMRAQVERLRTTGARAEPAHARIASRLAGNHAALLEELCLWIGQGVLAPEHERTLASEVEREVLATLSELGRFPGAAPAAAVDEARKRLKDPDARSALERTLQRLDG